MVLTFHAPPIPRVYRAAQWLPVVFTWTLAASLIALLFWSYFANPQPGPYGMCYERGRAIACHTLESARKAR